MLEKVLSLQDNIFLPEQTRVTHDNMISYHELRILVRGCSHTRWQQLAILIKKKAKQNWAWLALEGEATRKSKISRLFGLRLGGKKNPASQRSVTKYFSTVIMKVTLMSFWKVRRAAYKLNKSTFGRKCRFWTFQACCIISKVIIKYIELLNKTKFKIWKKASSHNLESD